MPCGFDVSVNGGSDSSLPWYLVTCWPRNILSTLVQSRAYLVSYLLDLGTTPHRRRQARLTRYESASMFEVQNRRYTGSDSYRPWFTVVCTLVTCM